MSLAIASSGGDVADSIGVLNYRHHIVICLMSRNATILGGQEVRWARIIEALSSIDCGSITVLCTRSLVESWERGNVGYANAKLIVYSDAGSKLRSWFGAQLFTLRHIPRGAIVHLTGPGMLVLPAAVIARFLKHCVLLTSLTTSRVLPFRKERFPRKGYWMFWVALKASHLVDALNPSIDVTSLVGAARLSIAPCSFSDPERFQSSNRKISRVVFAGHFNWQKGSDLLLGIISEWPRDLNCELALYGSGPYEPDLRAAAEGRPNIRIGHAWDLRQVFADTKVFLSLQQWDNYPSQSLLEAMLSECCIVATDTGDTGLLVKAPWGERLAIDASSQAYVDAAMRFLRMSESRRKQAGVAAREHVVRHHARDRYVEYLRLLWRMADSARDLEEFSS